MEQEHEKLALTSQKIYRLFTQLRLERDDRYNYLRMNQGTYLEQTGAVS